TRIVKSDVSFRRRSGRQPQGTWLCLREIGLAKRLERHSLSPSTLTSCSLNSVRRRICRCSHYIKTILTWKDTLSGSHATKMETWTACTSAPRVCATCRSYASKSESHPRQWVDGSDPF